MKDQSLSLQPCELHQCFLLIALTLISEQLLPE